jgi:hypothetical protein
MRNVAVKSHERLGSDPEISIMLTNMLPLRSSCICETMVDSYRILRSRSYETLHTTMRFDIETCHTAASSIRRIVIGQVFAQSSMLVRMKIADQISCAHGNQGIYTIQWLAFR